MDNFCLLSKYSEAIILNLKPATISLLKSTSEYVVFPQTILYLSHFQETADILKLKIVPSPERAVTIPGVGWVLCYNKSGIVRARSGDEMILSFKMSTGS